VQEAVVVRLSRFRTTRPAFDAVLRGSVLPHIRSQPGVLGVFAGRQGPDEVGVRLLASLWSSREAMVETFGDDLADDDGASGPLAATTHRTLELLPVLVVRLSDPPLPTGILRLARGRLGDPDLASYADMVRSDLAGVADQGPGDLIMAASGEAAFIMLSTWPDWSAIEAATGASISEPLRTKRMAALSSFEADHFELLTELEPATD
jgi:hypothetical protein